MEDGNALEVGLPRRIVTLQEMVQDLQQELTARDLERWGDSTVHQCIVDALVSKYPEDHDAD